MEKRTIIAVALSLMILITWSYFQKKNMPPPKAPAEKPVAGALKKPSAMPATEEKPPVREMAGEAVAFPEVTESGAGSNIIVESDLYKAVFSTKGAIVKYWELKKYKDNEKKPVVLLKEPGIIPPLSIIFKGPDQHLPQKIVYEANTSGIRLSGDKPEGELIFSYKKQGMLIKKKFVFRNDSYVMDLEVRTAGTPSYSIPVGTDFGVYDKKQREHKGPVMLVGTEREEFDEGMKSSKYFPENVHWIAQEDKYFTAALIPKTATEGATVWKESASAEVAYNLKSNKHQFIFYVGPKEYDRLKELGVGLEYMVDFGWFSVIAMPLFWVLKFFYKYLGNYGWAIILLTIVVRVPFIPIMHKSQQSMKKMQKIQPLMAELKEKYKNDSAKMQKEMMALYKQHKVNPVGGCLPMFLQIPVFIALYNVLLKAIELRGAPFALWITDLAARDPYYVLPIVMGITMVIQQKMTPSAMDPKQAKMMMLMPIIFTFMFLTFPSGLVIYWLVNNVLGILQQYYANKKASQ